MAANCPWSKFEAAKVSFCEHRLCDWVVEPANTWSNIGYFIAGAVVLYLARKFKRPDLQPIGYIGIFLSFASSALHATGTFWGEWVDHLAMNMFAGFALGFNLWRCKRLNARTIYVVMTFAAVIPSLIMIPFKPYGILLFVAMVVITGSLEIYANFSSWSGTKASRRHLFYLCGWFALAYAIWNLDFRHIICNPDNHILQGHSLWHLFNSMCFYHLFAYYKQFPVLGGSAEKRD